MNECWFSSDWRQISLSRKKLSSNLRLDVALIDGLEVCHWNIFESEIHIFAPEIFDKEISGDDVLVSSLPVGSLWSHLSDQHSQVRPDSEGRSRMLEMFWSATSQEVRSYHMDSTALQVWPASSEPCSECTVSISPTSPLSVVEQLCTKWNISRSKNQLSYVMKPHLKDLSSPY